METLSKVTEVLVDELGIEAGIVTLEAGIIADLGADSLAVMQIVMTLEDEFDIEIAEEDVLGLKTVADIVNYIDKQ